jgi:hypothetical protein
MEKQSIVWRAWLLFNLMLPLQSPSLFGQSTHFLIAPDLHKVSLTRTVFHGVPSHYSVTPFALDGESASRDMFSSFGRPDDLAFAWKYNIVATLFWIGEPATEGNHLPNTESAWDPDWVTHFGGEDSATQRVNFIPTAFTPRQNPFYVALPYNDVENHHTRPEAARVIPWFRDSFVCDGQSVCKGRWLAIRHGQRTCYAQWEDVGPFDIDNWQYVFRGDRPRPNRNCDAGLDVSPAVRDYLGMSGKDVCDWKFVHVYAVPSGPWALYGDNNTLARLRNQARVANKEE